MEDRGAASPYFLCRAFLVLLRSIIKMWVQIPWLALLNLAIQKPVLKEVCILYRDWNPMSCLALHWTAVEGGM